MGKEALGKRFWEIDTLRGIAIVMMIAFHLLFDLNYFRGAGFDLHSGPWLLLGRATLIIFLLLVGISLTLSRSRALKGGNAGLPKYLRRGVWIFSLGLLITLLTWILLPQGAIWFGVLHLIGISIILCYPVLRKKFLALFLGIAIIIIGLYLQTLTFNFPWLLWLGLMPSGFYTFDYVPVLPWLGVVLLGVFFGNLLYPDYKRGFRLGGIPKHLPVKILSFLGRHSLAIYFLHQPILLGLLYALVL